MSEAIHLRNRRRPMRLRVLVLLAGVCAARSLSAQPASADPAASEWTQAEIERLTLEYLPDRTADATSGGSRRAEIGRLFEEMGRRMSRGDAPAPSAEDVALLSWLYARREPSPEPDGESPGSASPPSPPADEAQGASDYTVSDLNKGNEGFLQGVESLAEKPVGERLVLTGDVTAGLQAATVSDNADLTSAFGRARMNFLLEAIPESRDGRLSTGYFFVQMASAGGPSDAAAVGGTASFSPLNDIASARSAFNEGDARGNIYLGRAFYQQSLRLRDGEIRGRAGIVDLTDFFDTNLFANNEARQFINGAFSNGAAFKTGVSAPGFMFEYERDPWLFQPDWLDRIVLRGGYAVSRTERAFTSPLWAGELELATTLRGRRGHWRLGGTAGAVADAGGLGTFHVSVDQWLTDRLGVFGRYGSSNTGEGSLSFGPVGRAYSGGMQWRFRDATERVSAWSIGFSQAFPSLDGLGSEKVLESYYRWQVTRNAALTPSFQLVSGAGGQSSGGLHTVYGVRLFFAY